MNSEPTPAPPGSHPEEVLPKPGTRGQEVGDGAGTVFWFFTLRLPGTNPAVAFEVGEPELADMLNDALSPSRKRALIVALLDEMPDDQRAALVNDLVLDHG